ncbi:MAG: metal-dependent hydrolase [Betaproteobacteria bacterium]
MIFFGHIGITLLLVFLVFTILKEKIDYRFLMIGAILPDLIDKPIGQYILNSIFQNGRIFAHTILFIFLLVVLAAYLERKYRFTGVSVLALGAIAHIAEDEMWRSPGTALWPLLGWEFPKLDLQDYSGYIWYQLLHNPSAYLPEIVGLIIIAGFVWRFELYRPERLKAFVKTGRLARAEMAVAYVKV